MLPEQCMSIRNRTCTSRRVNGDYMCAACRKEYEDYLYHRDLDRKEMLSGEWQGHALEPSARLPMGGWQTERREDHDTEPPDQTERE